MTIIIANAMPNEEEIKQELSEALEVLPPDLRQAVVAISLPEAIYRIGRKYALSIYEIGILGEIVFEFILGYIEPQQFINEIGQRLDTDREKSRAIGQEVNAEVFRPIREGLKEKLEVKVGVPPPAPKPSPPAPPPPQPVKPVPPTPPRPQPIPPYIPPQPKEAPIIRPFGAMPEEKIKRIEKIEQIEKVVERPVVQEVKPSAPARLEPIRVVPPPPAPPPPRPAAPPSSPHPTPPQTPTHPPSAPVITKAELERELEKFRTPGDRGQGLGDRERVSKEQPLKLPPQKISKPPAPERYTVDPYREPAE